jgi:hypothetical protein
MTKAAKKTTPKKTTPKVAPKGVARPVSTTRATPSPSRGDTAEDAAESVMEDIDSNDFAGSDASREDSIEFYKSIANACTERAETIQSELDKENDGW